MAGVDRIEIGLGRMARYDNPADGSKLGKNNSKQLAVAAEQ